jgi:tripartite-type tricarboxylate transporter receptor subunit TctC
MISMGLVRCTAVAVLALGFAGGARADDFPSRPITMIITFAAGGITDVVARIYADVASRNIGQRIIVDNRPPGGGAVAALAVQNAPPDGYTLLVFAGAQHAALPAMQPVAYQPVSGFQPVTILFNLVNFLAVPKDSPANSAAELVELGRRKPGGLSFGSAGVGSPAHLNAVRMARATNTPIEYVQYRGSAPMMADLVSGRLDFSLVSYTGAGSVRGRRQAQAPRRRLENAVARFARSSDPGGSRHQAREGRELVCGGRARRHTKQRRGEAQR